MPEQLLRVYQPVKNKWDALEKQQKIRLVAAVLVVVAALVVTVYFATRTKYTPFVENLTSLEVREMENALNEAGIKNKKIKNATGIAVDEKRVDDAKIEIETKSILSNTPFTYADAISNTNMGTTESQKRSMDLRAQQTELATALTGFDGVTNAIVFLVIPENTLRFVQDTTKPSASVSLTLTRALSRKEGEAVARFVCRGVEGLEMENIEITDSELNTVYSGSAEVVGDTGSYLDIQDQMTKNMINAVRAMFGQFYDEVSVAPNLAFDTRAVRQSERAFSSPDGGDGGALISDIGSSSKVTGGTTADAPGLEANDQMTPTYETGDGNTYDASSKEWDQSFVMNETVTETEITPGTYLPEQSSITTTLTMIDEYNQSAMMAADKSFTQASWEDFKRNTTRQLVQLSEDEEAHYVNMIKNATGINASAITITVWRVPYFNDYVRPGISWQQILMFVVLALLILLLAFGLIRKTQVDEEEEEVEPELTVEKLLATTKMEEEKEAAEEEAKRLKEIEFMKESETKRQIEKFVNEKPEAVAQLLRNWLNSEDWY